MSGGLRVVADDARCCSSGQCVLRLPEVFGQRDDDGVVVVLQPHPAPELLDDVRAAVDLCPAQCLFVESGSGRETP